MNGKYTGLIKTAFCRLQRHTNPDPRVWVFSSTENRYFNYNSKYLFEYVRTHCPDIRPRYVINDEALRVRLNRRFGADADGGDYFIETNSMDGIRLVLSAGVWFTSAGLPVYGLHLNEGRRIINLWHGVPLKTIALRDRTQSRFQRLYFRQIFSDNYTDVVSTSPAAARVMAKSLGVPAERVRIWGQPRCDCLFAPFDRAEFLQRYFPDLQKAEKIVLYAPTFRTGKATELFPFADFDRAALDAYLEEHGILLCIRMHLAEREGQPVAPSSRVRYFGEERLDDIMEVLAAFDLLITDYSSIYIDYLLLERPVIFLPYDLEEYRAAHGFSFPYERVTPGPKCGSFAAFLKSLDRSLSDPAADGYASARRKIRGFFYEEAAPCSGKIVSAVRSQAGLNRQTERRC